MLQLRERSRFDSENSFFGRMALIDDANSSVLGLKLAYCPKIKLYFRSAAIICF